MSARVCTKVSSATVWSIFFTIGIPVCTSNKTCHSKRTVLYVQSLQTPFHFLVIFGYLAVILFLSLFRLSSKLMKEAGSFLHRSWFFTLYIWT